jgi:hypothetical protein
MVWAGSLMEGRGTADTPSPLTTPELADRMKIKEVVAVAY